MILRSLIRGWLGIEEISASTESANSMASAAMSAAADAYDFSIRHVHTDHEKRTIGSQSSREDAKC